jgi:geranylgeranyl reductase family protein
VSQRRFDVLVVGAGPAGSIAALVLARGGASVALLDKSRFPRDKACGDLVGPRGLQLMDDLGLPVPPGLDVGDMVVVGPTGRRVLLPCFAGLTYPGRARAMVRAAFDDTLRTAALEAGAFACEGRADQPLFSDTGLEGFTVGTGGELRADFVVGADGATSRVANVAGMVDSSKVLGGFAVRCYLDQHVDLPTIALWEQTRWHAFPGYGWIFPSLEGGANAGIGIGALSDRQAGARVVRELPAFLEHLVHLGLLDRPPARPPPPRLGGWLKMGMVGTTPATNRVLLVGDAAGLVNPLQGEGIAQAMSSGRAAAGAILGSPERAAARYRDALARMHLPYQRVTAAAHSLLVSRPRAVAAVGRVLTAPVVGDALAGGWAIFWNELLDGAAPGGARTTAAASTRLGRVLTADTQVSRWFRENYPSSQLATEPGADDVLTPAVPPRC